MRGRYLLLLIALSSLIPFRQAKAADTVRFGGDHEFSPYEYKDADGRPAGINVELAAAVGEVMGFNSVAEVGDWTSIREKFDDGRIDVINMYRSPAREQLYLFSTPHAIFNHVIVMRKPVRQILALSDLKDLELIVSKNTYSDEVMHLTYP